MRRLIALLLIGGCASAGPPPGGVERHTPPAIVSISPDSGATNVNIKSVEFKFDEVVSDRPAGAGTALDQIFLVSPRNGAADVGWHRSRVTVRPRNGFRPNTAYRITMLPGLVDLRGNVVKEGRTIVFSTGPTFPPFSIPGIVFDWVAQRPASGAYIEAASKADTSIVYIGASDSTGHFDLGPLPAGTYLVHALIDQNANRTIDRNEKWDSTTVTITNARSMTELDVIERDSVPAVMENVARLDSVTIRITFDKPLDPHLEFQPSQVTIKRADSTTVPVLRVQGETAYDRARQATDSARRADSTKAAQKPDSARRADTTKVAPPAPPATAPGGRRAPPPPPKPSTPPPDRAIIVTVAPTTPFVVGVTYRITANSMRNLVGHARESSRLFTVPKPAPPKPAPADTTRRPPPIPLAGHPPTRHVRR